jgi:hypothetical protein
MPDVDVRVDASRLGNIPVNVLLDVRSRRSTVSGSGGRTADAIRVHSAMVSYTHRASGMMLSAGRQYSVNLSPVSLFDGVLLGLHRRHWGVGAFSGTQPASDLGFDPRVRQTGGFVDVHNASGASRLWSLTLGGAASRDSGEVNREFGFVQMNFSDRHLTLFATQEVDVNRGWKAAAESHALIPTSRFIAASVRVGNVGFNAGADSRRNVRLFRDFLNREVEFDDANRRGYWGGSTVSLFRHATIGGDVRQSRSDDGSHSSHYTGFMSIDRLTRAHIGARVRATRFRSDVSGGWLHSWSASASPTGCLQLDFGGGVRTQHYHALANAPVDPSVLRSRDEATWWSTGVDLNLGRRWYLTGTLSVDRNTAGSTTQLYSGLVLRF